MYNVSMVKFMSQLIGAEIILFQERVIVGRVTRVLIDPDNGSLVGFVARPVHQNKDAYIPTNEIKGLGKKLIIVEGLSSLSAADDVVKIDKVLKNEPMIIGSQVYSESGQHLGRVEDATLDMTLAVLKKLYVKPLFLAGILKEQQLIDASQIVKIEEKKIIVRDSKIKEKSALAMPAEIPLAE